MAVTLLAFVGILCRDLPVYSVMGADETGERCGAGDGGGTGLGSWETWIQLEEERKDGVALGPGVGLGVPLRGSDVTFLPGPSPTKSAQPC